ncbi:protein NPG1-like [Dioscorea cayenensis subsp. rotundata]|uniref:Protein NPG1-like n=1 Tax=Dioscorea cayennensis subsp. rotundata TaxID=55577 RepID=A0AB40AVS3_DIOCR|nr:protein NPG1-like [Dioscorea cayenensis subsp. rotundata]
MASDAEVENGREVSANGLSMKTSDVEAKLDQGNIAEAESVLREGLSLNSEEARALLGRLEYQRGNIEAALRVFEGIDLQAALQRLQPTLSEKTPSRRRRSRTESIHSVSHSSVTLVLEAQYLKSLSLQKLGKANEAAQECVGVLDAVEKIFQNGIPDTLVDSKLRETVNKVAEILPELWKQTGKYQEVLAAYRRALLGPWNLDCDFQARIQKRFALFLLFSGVEYDPPKLAAQVEGSYVPKNNLEEAILLLMILMRKSLVDKSQWDPSVMELLTFALSIGGQTSMLGRQFEELSPGMYPRYDRWNNMALCYTGAGQKTAALSLLRKSLSKHENPDDILALLLASKICSEDQSLASEGIEYARRALANAQVSEKHLKGAGLRFLGICLGKQAKVVSSDQERSHFQSEALEVLNEAISIECDNPDLLFDLGLQYAENGNLNGALRCSKQFIDATGGSVLKGWRLLVLVLSAQQRYSEAEVILDAALDETAKLEQGPLLRLKAKLKVARSLPMDAVDTYRLLFALIQAQKKSGNTGNIPQVEDEKVSEYEVWKGLANLYSSLSHWRDVEICLEKAKALQPNSAALLHMEGIMHEARGDTSQALSTFSDAVLVDPSHVPSKVSMGVLLWRTGSKSLSAARAFLSDALRLERTNRLAWYYLGMVHKDEGRLLDATDCFQAASMLEESDPIESFSSIS